MLISFAWLFFFIQNMFLSSFNFKHFWPYGFFFEKSVVCIFHSKFKVSITVSCLETMITDFFVDVSEYKIYSLVWVFMKGSPLWWCWFWIEICMHCGKTIFSIRRHFFISFGKIKKTTLWLENICHSWSMTVDCWFKNTFKGI